MFSFAGGEKDLGEGVGQPDNMGFVEKLLEKALPKGDQDLKQDWIFGEKNGGDDYCVASVKNAIARGVDVQSTFDQTRATMCQNQNYQCCTGSDLRNTPNALRPLYRLQDATRKFADKYI